MQGPPESLLWPGTLLQTGKSEVNDFEIGSLQEVSAHARWTWASRPPSTLSFIADGLPSVLSPPWSLSGPAVPLNGDTSILSTLLQPGDPVSASLLLHPRQGPTLSILDFP